jgi:hypothetical protein
MKHSKIDFHETSLQPTLPKPAPVLHQVDIPLNGSGAWR